MPVGGNDPSWTSTAEARRKQTIFRNVTPEEPYTRLPNTLLRDTRLELDERGALSDILSRPPHWDFSEEHFCRENRIGRDRCRRIVRALEKVGYCKRKQDRTPDGKLGSAVYLFSAIPGHFNTVDGKPVDGEPTTGKPSTGEPWTANSTREIKERDKQKKEETLPSGEAAQERAHAPAVEDPGVGPGYQDAQQAQPEQVEPQPAPEKLRKAQGARGRQSTDLFGEAPAKRARNTKTEFPDDFDGVDECFAFGLRAGLTQQEVELGLMKCKLHYLGNGERKADWLPVVQKWLLGDADRKRKRAPNGAHHSGSSTGSARDRVRAKFEQQMQQEMQP